MMEIVLDASAAGAWCIETEAGRAEAGLLIEQLAVTRGIVPGVFSDEMRNLLLVAERKGRHGEGAALGEMERIRALQLRTDHEQNDKTILMLARRHGLSGYDAVYLETAKRRRTALATSDRRLARATAKAGVPNPLDRELS